MTAIINKAELISLIMNPDGSCGIEFIVDPKDITYDGES